MTVKYKVNWSRILMKMGHWVANEWRLRVARQLDIDGKRFPPNRPATLARKKGNKRLIDTGALVQNGLRVRAVGSHGVSVGFQDNRHPGKRGKKGKPPKLGKSVTYRQVAMFNLSGDPGANPHCNPVRHFGKSEMIERALMTAFFDEVAREVKRGVHVNVKMDVEL